MTLSDVSHHTPRPIGKGTLPGQIVLVMQGGGAPGSYQAGVYQALHEAGIEPDWVVGTSIGAINGAIIVGNQVSDRVERLKDFWERLDKSIAPPFIAWTDIGISPCPVMKMIGSWVFFDASWR